VVREDTPCGTCRQSQGFGVWTLQKKVTSRTIQWAVVVPTTIEQTKYATELWLKEKHVHVHSMDHALENVVCCGGNENHVHGVAFYQLTPSD
jgi:hypothetical protein